MTKPKEKKNSLIISVRLSESDILKGIQVFILNNQKPSFLSDVVKQLYIAGLKATYGQDAENIIPKKTAIEILDLLTKQRVKKPNYNLKVKSNKLSKLTIKEEDEVDCKNASLLMNISLEDKSAGFMILKNLETTNDITGNLNSPNKVIRRITAELFWPICHDMNEKELIQEVYTATRR